MYCLTNLFVQSQKYYIGYYYIKNTNKKYESRTQRARQTRRRHHDRSPPSLLDTRPPRLALLGVPRPDDHRNDRLYRKPGSIHGPTRTATPACAGEYRALAIIIPPLAHPHRQ